MEFTRQRVVLPGGTAYWSVVDQDFQLVQPFDAFLRFLRLDKGCTEKTTQQYGSTFAEWSLWLSAQGALGDLVRAAELLGSFRFHLARTPVERVGSGRGRPRSDARIGDMLAAIRSFYRWAVSRRYVGREVNDLLYEIVEARGSAVGWMEDPPDFIARPIHRTRSSGDSAPKCVSSSEFESMLAAPGLLRDKLLICLLGLEGMRVQEAVNIRRQDMHLMQNSGVLGCGVKGPHLHVLGKGEKRRWVPANPYVIAVYSAHVLERAGIPAAEASDSVLVNLRGGQVGDTLTTGRARKVVSALARRAGVGRHVTPHQFRHGLATELIERGRSLDEVQRLLGHASVETTRRYIHSSDARLRAAINSVPLPRRYL